MSNGYAGAYVCPDGGCAEVFGSPEELKEHVHANGDHLRIKQEEVVMVFAHGSRFGTGKYSIGTNSFTIDKSESRQRVLPSYLKPHTTARAALYAVIHAIRNAPLLPHTKALTIKTDSEYAIRTFEEIEMVYVANGFRDPQGKEPLNIDLMRELSGLVAVVQKLGCQVRVEKIDKKENKSAIELARRAKE